MEGRDRKARKEVLGRRRNRPLIGCLKEFEKREIRLTAIASEGQKEVLDIN